MEKDFKLERAAYQETLWYIRQYPNFLYERQMILNSRGQSYGTPRGNEVGDPTAQTAIRLERVDRKIEPIKKALASIPQEYRDGLLKNIIQHVRYPDYADTSTWKRWRRRLIWYVHEFREVQQNER